MAHMDTAFVFDLDGTLIDSVYQHVLAWQEALDAENIELSAWRIHRKIGMSGGLFTNMLIRETQLDISQELLDRLSPAMPRLFAASPARSGPCPERVSFWLT